LCALRFASRIGRSATRSRSAFEGGLFDTLTSPSKSPVEPRGMVGFLRTVIVENVKRKTIDTARSQLRRISETMVIKRLKM